MKLRRSGSRRPAPGLIWRIDNQVAATILWALFALGWLVVLISTFLISHFELFGLSQVWGHARGTRARAGGLPPALLLPPRPPPDLFGLPARFLGDAAHDRRPPSPRGRGSPVYILIAIRFEERDLVGMFGPDYEAYRARVGKLTPRVRRRRAG